MDHEQLNVLVIDDDAAMTELLTQIILRLEHQVIAVASAEEGLEQLPYWTFDVAFIDQNLPGMEGLVLGEYLRRNNEDMTLALVTGDEDRSLAKRSRDLDIVYIAKPFDIGAIHAVLERCRERAETRRRESRERAAERYDLVLAPQLDAVTEAFSMPNVPARVSDRIVETIKLSLNQLRTNPRYSERDRAIAYAGLVTARVLGLDLPKTRDVTLYDEYDALMRDHGCAPAFAGDEGAQSNSPGGGKT